MSPTNSGVSDLVMHDTDSYFGRPHRRGSGRVVSIRPLLTSDLDDPRTKGRVGVDFRIQYDRETPSVLTPEQYQQYELIEPKEAHRQLIKLYDWLKRQAVPVISNVARVTDPAADGVTFQLIEVGYDIKPTVRLSVGSNRAIGDLLTTQLRLIGINAPMVHDSFGWTAEFSVDELAKVPD